MNEGIGENHAIIIKGFSHTVGGGGVICYNGVTMRDQSINEKDIMTSEVLCEKIQE